jgi:hypothetical protein
MINASGTSIMAERWRVMSKVLTIVTICLCCAPRAWANPKSLCTSVEDDLFACSIGRKVASICASKDLSGTSGYVQYKYGQANMPPELVYPIERRHPSKAFSYGSTGSAKSSLENLQFTVSGNSYTVYRETAAFDAVGSGILVKTRDGNAVRLNCSEARPPSNLHVLGEDGLRKLPEEALVSLDALGTWPAESPNADLLQGVRTHDFSLVEWAIKNGADVNYHGQFDVGVLGFLVDRRADAIQKERVEEYDDETIRLLDLLLAHGASPSIATVSGATAIDFLNVRGASDPVILKLLDAGWSNNYANRLYTGLVLGKSDLVEEALNRGVDPNGTVRGARYLTVALIRPCRMSWGGDEAEQLQSLAALKQLLDAGAKIHQGNKFAGGDITGVYANYGDQPNIRPVLDLLIHYASQEDKQHTIEFLTIVGAGNPKRRANYDWLLKRLKEEVSP